MTGTRQRIVVGVDGSDGARVALTWALAEAARRGADVDVVTAYPFDFYWLDPYLPDGIGIDDLRAETETRARSMVQEVRDDPALAEVPGVAAVGIRLQVVGGAPAVHLVEWSEGAALLVVGSRGRGAVRSAVAGSVALHCSAHATCPVVVVHPTTPSTDDGPRVVVGLDDSDTARAALSAATQHATALGARVDVVVAYQTPDYWVDQYAVVSPPAELRARALARGTSIVTEVLGAESLESGRVRVLPVEGPAARVLIEEAQGARLLVVGSRSHNPIRAVLLGSVALRCVMHAPCPVLVVRATADRVSPGGPPASGEAVLTGR